MSDEKIIVVEDDADLRSQVCAYLTLSGFTVVEAGSAAELYRRMAVESAAVIVLDLRLPDEDGLTVAAHVRNHSRVGIIMMTARGEIEDRLRGLEAGADIYLAKPVDLRELNASIRSLCRRMGLGTDTTVPSVRDGWHLVRNSFSLMGPTGRSVSLTANEVALLNRLTVPCGTVVGRGDLLAVLGYAPDDPSNRNLDAALRRLRLKVEQSVGLPLPLRTVHSVGYLLTEHIAVT